MPRNTREWAMRKLQSGADQCNWVGTHLQEVYDKYITAHPEIAGSVRKIQTLVLVVQTAIEELKKSF